MSQTYSKQTKDLVKVDIAVQVHKTTLRAIEDVLFLSIIECLIADNEGYRSKAYWDLKRWSIGYGTISYKEEVITEPEARRRLEEAIMYAKETAPKLVTDDTWKSLTPSRKGVLVEMVYVLGFKGALNFGKTLSLIKDGMYKEASIELMDSKWYKQAKTRVKQIADRLCIGEWLA